MSTFMVWGMRLIVKSFMAFSKHNNNFYIVSNISRWTFTGLEQLNWTF